VEAALEISGPAGEAGLRKALFAEGVVCDSGLEVGGGGVAGVVG